MSKIWHGLWMVAALASALVITPATASARGPIRYVIARPVVRAPVTVVRTARMIAPPYYAPRSYVPTRVYVAPIGGAVIYID